MPSISTAGMMSHPRPSSCARSFSSAALPLFLWPKRKSCPATSHPARYSSCRKLTKSSQGMVIMARSKGTTTTSIPGKSAAAVRRRSAAVVSKGTGRPVTNSLGERSKVTIAGVSPRSRLRSMARRSRAWWPRWTPSKKPRAITRFLLFSMASSTGGSSAEKILDGPQLSLFPLAQAEEFPLLSIDPVPSRRQAGGGQRVSIAA